MTPVPGQSFRQSEPSKRILCVAKISDLHTDADGCPQTAYNAPRNPPQRARRDDTGMQRRCDCPLDAIQRTVSKEGPNKGRSFWICPSSKTAQCKFFEVGWRRPQGALAQYQSSSRSVG